MRKSLELQNFLADLNASPVKVADFGLALGTLEQTPDVALLDFLHPRDCFGKYGVTFHLRFRVTVISELLHFRTRVMWNHRRVVK